jgi:cytochrome P450
MIDDDKTIRDMSKFDNWDPELSYDPQPIYTQLRHGLGITRSEQYGGFWAIARYQDVQAVAYDKDTFSNCSNGFPDRANPARPLRPVELDGAEHLQYRNLLNPSFSPGSIHKLEQLTHSIARSLLAPHVERGQMDLAQDFAMKLPAMVIAHLLEIPHDDFEEFVEHALEPIRAMMGDEAARQRAVDSTREDFSGFGSRMLTHYRANPGNGLISQLLRPEGATGQALTDEEFLDTWLVIATAGQDTTVALICFALLHLAQNQDIRLQLRDNPSLVLPAVEEYLRTESPVHVSVRTAVRDVTLCESAIDEGDKVLLMWGAANADPSAFEMPHEFHVDRAPNRHMAFGVGIHRCLGIHLARMEARVAIKEVLQVIPDFEVPEEGEIVRYNLAGVVRGIWSLPATWKTVSENRS